MEAHVTAGNRAEALRVYERCRRLLANELGAYPSPETEAIYRSLLEAPTPPPEAAQAPTGEARPAGPAPTADTALEAVEAPARRQASRKWVATAAAVTVALGAAVTAAVLATRGGGAHAPSSPSYEASARPLHRGGARSELVHMAARLRLAETKS
jgi:hypothetical protein